MWKTPRSIMIILVIPLFMLGMNKCALPRRWKQLHSFMSICVALITFIVIIYEHHQHVFLNILWNFSYSFEFVCVVVYNVAYGQDFLNQIETKLQKIDANKKRKDTALIILTSLMISDLLIHKFYQAYKMLVSGDDNISRMSVYILSQIGITCCDLECVWRFYLILLVHNRVSCVYNDLKDVYPKEWYDTVDTEQDKDVVKLFNTYVSLAEMAAEVAENIQLSFVLRLATELLGIFVGLYIFSLLGFLNDSTLTFTVSVINMNLMSLLPSLVAEMTLYKCEDIKMLLVQQSLRKSIRIKEKRALRHFVDYISLQPVKFRLFNSFELGTNFVVNVTRVTTTFCIFLLQSAKMKFF